VTETRRVAVAITLVAVAILLTFSGSLDNELVNWDDGNYIVLNELVTQPGAHGWRDRLTTPGLGYAVPLPVLIYAWLWTPSEAAWPFHLLSLLVHVANASLLLWLLWDTSRRLRVAALGAAAFAVHPLVVEPVAWATGLKDLLVGTGCLLAIVGLRRGWPSLAGSLVAFASKPSAVLLGPALAAFAWVDQDRAAWKRVSVAGPVVVITLLGIGLLWFTSAQETEQLRTSTAQGLSATRIFGAVGLHLEHVLIPAASSPRYPISAVSGGHIALGVLAVVGTGVLGLRWLRNRDPRFGWLALGVATYLPASNLRPLIRFTADSYVYVPWMAVTACVALSVVRNEESLARIAGKSLRALRGLAYAAVGVWALVAYMEVETWSDTRSLWAVAAERYPDDGELIYRYGDALGRADDRQAELALYFENLDALRSSPMIPAALVTWYQFNREYDEVDAWYALAFASSVRQDDAVYWHYVDYVARHPQRHSSRHDVALGHALGVYDRMLDQSELDATALGRLAEHAQRLGRPDLAMRFGDRGVLASP
jgi:hypothetical protein